MKILSEIFLINFLLFLSFKCSPTEPPEDNKAQLSISVEEVSCTEVWLKLKTEGLSSSSTVNIERDGTIAAVIANPGNKDTIIFLDSLLPNKQYSFQAIINKNTESVKISSKVLATTLDTTSHNFTWQAIEFGSSINASMLYDVAVINENNIWAVGEIYMNDSLGEFDPVAYNAAYWNGEKWELKRIPFTGCGAVIYPRITSIFSFNQNDIWFSRGGSLVHFYNSNYYNDCSLNSLLTGSINKIWGTSADNLYVIGENGNIIRYSGQNWQKLENNTKLELYDIYSKDGKNIYATGGSFQNSNGILLKENSNKWEVLKEGKIISAGEIFNPYFAGVGTTVWESKNGTVYFGGNLLYRYKLGAYSYVKNLPGNYIGGNNSAQNWGFITMLRGNSDNDMVFAGERNTIRHFNGLRWVQLGMPYDVGSDYNWGAVDMKKDLIAAVGSKGRQAAIILLKRN